MAALYWVFGSDVDDGRASLLCLRCFWNVITMCYVSICADTVSHCDGNEQSCWA